MPIKPDTKQILADSLQALLKKKAFDNITVQDIIDHCGASRSAFYNHFKDKYDLMTWIYKNRVDEIVKQNSELLSWRHMSYQHICFIKEKGDYFSNIILYNGQNSFTDYLYSYALNYCEDQLRRELHVVVLPEEILFAVKLYCAGSAFMIYDWVKSGFKESSERITQLMCDSIPQTINKYFK